MRPLTTTALVFSTLVALAGAGAAIGPALAHDDDNVATRCGAWGCNVIRCNYTGDRCYRLDGGYRRYDDGYGYGYRQNRYDNRYDRYGQYDRYQRRGQYGEGNCNHRHDRGAEAYGYGGGHGYGNAYGYGGEGSGDCGCDAHRGRYGRGGYDERYRDDYWQQRGGGGGEGDEQRW